MRLQHSFTPFLRGLCLAGALFGLLAFLNLRPSYASAGAMAYVRVIHASPDIGTVDVFLDGKTLLSNFQFATVTDYVPVPAGAHTVQIALIGKGINAAVITQTLTVNAGSAYTVAALGTRTTAFSLAIFTDDNSVTGNGAKVRIYHLSPGTGSATVTSNAQMLTSDLTYQQASDYAAVAAGNTTFHVTINPASVTIPVSTTIKPWTVTSIFVLGLLNGNPHLQFVSSQQQGIPGMPQTGYGPLPVTPTPVARLPWLLLLAAVVMIGIGAVTYRRTALLVKARYH